ncbi:putative transporter YfdV [uncultured Roseburia sp.]|uniref:AEC family transporter n=1 Tax=Brotonthovivens ammoniilytica TaxID=2981725 RepID=A0ABT2TM20_9FIRM|nr:AEC family transporter [Brotonthovivens ammoniilytica]MCU6763268.1 AEC family transporter [Brotonthovivens ammoniilytica]SCJ11443.1 putative transporter YfdV [uncultured Roseburia sp.]
MSVVVSSVVILFILIFVGFYIGRRGIIRQECTPDLSNFILKVTMPVTVFVSMIQQENLSLAGKIWQIMFMTLVLHLVSFLIGLGVIRALRIPKQEQGIWLFNCMFTNNGFMGFPLGLSIWGNDGLFLMAVANVVSNFLIFSMGLKFLTKYYPVKEKINLKRMVVNNLNLAVVIGFVFYLAQIHLPEIPMKLLNYLSDITAGLSMIVVGLSLSRMQIRQVFSNKKIFLLAAVRLLALPCICAAVLKWLPISADSELVSILILMSALPAASSQTILTEQYGTNTQDASRAILVTTLFCVVTIPFVMSLAL